VNPTRRRFGCALCALPYLLGAGVAAAQPNAAKQEFLPPGYTPPPSSDEKGLWSLVARAERDLKNSRFVIRDAELNAYLRDIACRLAEPYCPDLRIYLVRTAQFNASMAPNGMMQVWTGLLLRCIDEAQLAAVVGHEMGHYLRQHTVKRWRDARAKADFSAFLGLGLAVAGLGAAAPMTSLALVATSFAFSRDQEREADEIGLDLMTRAGYAPVSAAEVWEQLLAELNASGSQRSQQLFFATHPAMEERMKTLRAAAGKLEGEDRARERYLGKLADLRTRLIGDELALRQYARSEVVFDRLLAQVPDDGALWYAKGEVYRLRSEAGDGERALAAYGKALDTPSAPPETLRSVMLVELKAGRRERAQAAFDNYLRRKPDAADADPLRMLLSR
jgi:predicted Zn-dependent protease